MKDLPLIFIFLCCFCSVPELKAQFPVTRAEDYRDHRLWMQTANPAGLIFNAGSSFSVAEAAYHLTNGDLRTANEPASLQHFRIHTESYRSFKRVMAHGRFGYQNDVQNGHQWQATLQPEAHLVGFGDSVAGRQTSETYNISGGIALPMGRKGWHFGTELDYYARTGRKHIDPRNQNTQTDLHITPGILYRRESFGIGGSFSYRRIGEDVDYSILDGGSHDLYTIYPLWFCISEDFSVSAARSYQEERFGGALQLWGKGQRFEWLCEGRYAKGTESCDISVTTDSRAGETGRQEFNWNGQLRFGGNSRHTFRPAYQRLVRTGYDNLQSVPEHSTSSSNLQYGKAKRSAITRDLVSLDYNLLSVRDSLSGCRKIKVRAEWQREQTQFFVYPATFTQIIRHFSLAAGYSQQFRIRQRHMVEIKAEAAYRNGGGNLPEAETGQGYPLPEINIPQRRELLMHDFHMKTAQTLLYSLEIQYTRYLKSTYAVFSRAGMNCRQEFSDPHHRFGCGLSAGLLF